MRAYNDQLHKSYQPHQVCHQAPIYTYLEVVNTIIFSKTSFAYLTLRKT